MEEWSTLFSNKGYQILKQTKLDNGKLVSTVWLGINHNYGENSEVHPIIFESMVFDKDGKDIAQYRYETEEEAFAGHHQLVVTHHTATKLCDRWQQVMEEEKHGS